MCRDALVRVRDAGASRRLVNLFIDGEDMAPMRSDWPVLGEKGDKVGFVTSRVWSLKCETNIAFAMIDAPHHAPGTRVTIDADGDARSAEVRTDRWESA